MILESITLKNFLSYGNVATTWNLNKHKSTLIIGENGSGKSSAIADGVCFALFGRAYRNINKGGLVNSINQRELVVELTLYVNNIKYVIRRGIKPNLFEIYQNDELINQEAATRDYQNYLEKQILKISFKTFCQVVILGSASFTPFMQLPTGQRREVIEDILDIGIFSVMNSLLKKKIENTKDELRILAIEIDSAKKETISQQKLISVMEDNNESRIIEELTNIKTLTEQKTVLLNEIEVINKEKNGIKYNSQFNHSDDIVRLNKELTRYELLINDAEYKMGHIKDINFCTTCNQGITAEHKKHIIADSNGVIEFNRIKCEQLKEELSALTKVQDEESKKHQQVIQLNFAIENKEREINTLDTRINQHQYNINERKKHSSDIKSEKVKLKQIADNALGLLKKKGVCLEEKNVQEIANDLLKDGGIKTAIIKEYLPLLNKLINKYLGMFGFFINFHLDNEFNESIKSRGRDEFSYSNFSEGEKRRIDISILLAFRQIAALKNSIDINLLVADEILDSSMSMSAKETFNEIINNLSNTNVFVASHTIHDFTGYDAVIKVEKNGNFSEYHFVN